MSQPQNSYGYVDTTYLNLTTEQLQHFKELTYEKMHLQPGQHVLDLGCGPASDTLALAVLVGETGRVVGVDYDPAMIASAQQKAEAAGVSHYVSHELHDAVHLPYADNSFDSCRSERVFQHLEAPDQALAELVRVTKPGGWVVILDADWATISYYSSLPDIEAKVNAAYRAKGALYPIIGRQLHHMMHQLHLESVTALPITLSYSDYQNARYVFALERLTKRGLDAGYLTQEEIDRFLADLKQIDTQGDFFVYVCAVVAAGQKPQ